MNVKISLDKRGYQAKPDSNLPLPHKNKKGKMVAKKKRRKEKWKNIYLMPAYKAGTKK